MRHGGKHAIAKVARTQPAALLKIIALTLPKEHKVEHTNRVGEMSDQELDDLIERLDANIAARGDGARVIEAHVGGRADDEPQSDE